MQILSAVVNKTNINKSNIIQQYALYMPTYRAHIIVTRYSIINCI